MPYEAKSTSEVGQPIPSRNSHWLMNTIFAWCVVFLQQLARAFGTTYETINVLIFVFIWPVITIVETIAIAVLLFRLRRLKAS